MAILALAKNLGDMKERYGNFRRYITNEEQHKISFIVLLDLEIWW
jgi:formyltetrahydrofolate synthetase